MIQTPSNAEINGMNKDQLKKCIKELIKDINEERQAAVTNPLVDEDHATVTQLLTSVLAEVKDLKAEKTNLKLEFQKLKQENLFLAEAVTQHQSFLEAIDGEKRAKNLIVNGVPEDSAIVDGAAAPATTDREKLSFF
jgi:hypothetical protein